MFHYRCADELMIPKRKLHGMEAGNLTRKLGQQLGLANCWSLRRFDIPPIFQESLRDSKY